MQQHMMLMWLFGVLLCLQIVWQQLVHWDALCSRRQKAEVMVCSVDAAGLWQGLSTRCCFCPQCFSCLLSFRQLLLCGVTVRHVIARRRPCSAAKGSRMGCSVADISSRHPNLPSSLTDVVRRQMHPVSCELVVAFPQGL